MYLAVCALCFFRYSLYFARVYVRIQVIVDCISHESVCVCEINEAWVFVAIYEIKNEFLRILWEEITIFLMGIPGIATDIRR